MKFVENLIQPQSLLILWQATDPQKGQALGARFVIGEVRSENGEISLEYYSNKDTETAISQYAFKGFTAYPYASGKTHKNVEDFLTKRFASPSRSDYEEYLHSYRLPISNAGKFTTLQMLAYTGGILPGDGFSFVPDFEDCLTPFDFTMEIAGFRHWEGMHISPLSSLMDKPVSFILEPQNDKDPDAIAIFYGEVKLGYAPKGLATYFKKNVMNAHRTENFVCKVNGTKERPKITVLVQVR